MPGASQKKLLNEWQQLLNETRVHEAELAGLVALREELQMTYSRALATRGMRDTLQTSSRDAGRRLRELLAEGRDVAGGLRRFVKGVRPGC